MIASFFFDYLNVVRIRYSEPVAGKDGIGAYRRHDPWHLRQSLLHSAGVLVYLQEKGGESMTRVGEGEFAWLKGVYEILCK